MYVMLPKFSRNQDKNKNVDDNANGDDDDRIASTDRKLSKTVLKS